MRLEYKKEEIIDYNKIKISDYPSDYFWNHGHHKPEDKPVLENFCKIMYKMQSEARMPISDEEKKVYDIFKRSPIDIYCNFLSIPLSVENGRHRMVCMKELNLPYKFPVSYNIEFVPLKEFNLSKKNSLFSFFKNKFRQNTDKDSSLYTLAIPDIFDVKEILKNAGLEPVVAKEYNGENNFLIVDTRNISLDELLKIIPVYKYETQISVGKNPSIQYER